MRDSSSSQQLPSQPIKEISSMSRRFAVLIAALAIALTTVAVMSVGASAASPWWQILDGSRPSNLWEPTDSVQEIKTLKVKFAGEEVLIAKVEVAGETVGCMAAGNFAPAGGLPA